MFKKLIIILAAVFFFSQFNFARAEIIIKDVVYDPPGADDNVEYIKVQNTDIVPVDLSAWYVADYDTAWHFHKIKAENSGLLPAGAEALIVNTSQANFSGFKTKMPSYTGQLFRASFTLSNDQGRIGLSPDKKSIVGDTSYIAPPPAPKVVVPAVLKKEKKNVAKKIQPPLSPLSRGTANVVSSVPPAKGGTEGRSNSGDYNYSSIYILIPVLIFSSFAVYFIRRKKVEPVVGNNFEILDE